jgi:hypothetical protein
VGAGSKVDGPFGTSNMLELKLFFISHEDFFRLIGDLGEGYLVGTGVIMKVCVCGMRGCHGLGVDWTGGCIRGRLEDEGGNPIDLWSGKKRRRAPGRRSAE